MYKILFIDLLDNYRILLTVKNIRSEETLKVEIKKDLLDKAEYFKRELKLIDFISLITTNQKKLTAIDFN